jgi:aspartate oxidase
VYENAGEDFHEHGPVVLASDGFEADFTSNSLSAQCRLDLMHRPTTNGEHCIGDGIKVGVAIGAKTIDWEWVQVHKFGDPDAEIEFLAAEALRGVGGIIKHDADEEYILGKGNTKATNLQELAAGAKLSPHADGKNE